MLKNQRYKSRYRQRGTTDTASLIKKLALVVVGMFFFGFALVPLYDVFCEVTGLNGKTNEQAYIPAEQLIDTSREVTVQFVATNNESMPWEFRPEVFKLKVNPGQEVRTTFFAMNPRAIDMVGQAIPSVSPGKAAAYFHKTECFCFNSQPLLAGTSADMPLSFIVDRGLPETVHTITLSYTLFDITDTEQGKSVLAKEVANQNLASL